MNKRLLLFLFLLQSVVVAFSQETINEFVVKVDKTHNPMTFYSSYGATPNDGVVIINSRIPDLEFGILSVAKERLRKVVPDKGNNRYLLIIQPNDNYYKRYTITMKASGFMRGRIESVVVKAGLSSGYIVNPKDDANVYKIGDDAYPFLGKKGFKIAYIDASGKHGFAIKEDGESTTTDSSHAPSIDELWIIYSNRYSLGLSGEYWSKTDANNLNRRYTIDFSTGETHKRKWGSYWKYKNIRIVRF